MFFEDLIFDLTQFDYFRCAEKWGMKKLINYFNEHFLEPRIFTPVFTFTDKVHYKPKKTTKHLPQKSCNEQTNSNKFHKNNP